MSEQEHVCPVWMGKLMVSPLRKLYQNPKRILSPYLNQGMKVVEIGPGLGYFSLPIAKIIGDKGRLYCVDIQEGMLAGLKRRAKKAKLANIETILSTKDSFGLGGLKDDIDFAFLFAVVHEVPNRQILFDQVAAVLKPKGTVLFAEPNRHVSEEQFNSSVGIAKMNGLKAKEKIKIKGSHAILLEKT